MYVSYICTQYTGPAQPDGLSIDFINISVANVTYDNLDNHTFINYTVTMEIVPATCDHVIPMMAVQTNEHFDGNHSYMM